MKKILLVEDEENFGSLLQNYLRISSYEVHWAKDGALGWSAFNKEQFDLCILDVMMPNMDGFTLAEKIKHRHPETHLLFLTAKTLKEDIVKGYKLGAVDYLNKPFDIEVLLLKLEVILATPKKETEIAQYQIGEFTYEVSTRMLSHPAKKVRLSPKEGALLQLLSEHFGKVMPREKALVQIWKEDSYFTTRSMDVYITKLRKYLALDKNMEIENVHSMGYRLLVNDVVELGQEGVK